MIASIVLAAAAASPAPRDPYPEVAKVNRIEIRSAWGSGMGTRRFNEVVIERTNGELLYGDMAPEPRIVAALISALDAEPIEAATPTLLGMTQENESLESEPLRSCVGDAADLPHVVQAYRALWVDPGIQRRWISEYYRGLMWHTDDYPNERVRVTFSDGSTIEAQSASQNAFMLPFEVTRAGQTYKTYDPALPRALAEIASGDVNREKLKGYLWSSDFGSWVCGTYQNRIDTAVLEAFTPEVASFVRANGVIADRFGLTDDLGTLHGSVRFPRWPTGLTFTLDAIGAPLDRAATQRAGLSALKRAAAFGDRVGEIPWVAAWLRGPDNPRFDIQVLDRVEDFDLREILKSLDKHNPALAEIARTHLKEVLYCGLWDGHHTMMSGWLVLPDDRAVLLTFFPSKSTVGPVDPSRVAKWPSIAGFSGPDDEYGTVTIVDRNGRVVSP